MSYLNTRPLVYGLKKLSIADKIELIETYPSRLAQMLQQDEIDVGMVPIAVIPTLKEYHINGNFCIGADGDVASVALFSDVPLLEIKKIYLDYQSRTSVALLKWLIANYWHIHPELIQSNGENYIDFIEDDVAGLIIGDRALEYRGKTKYVFDLSGEWKAATGLPFVFAAWVSNKPLSTAFIAEFDKANAYGFEHLDEVIAEHPYEVYDLKTYYTKNLSHVLDEKKRKGMELFLKSI